jgi:hypothetical protein
LKGKCQISSLQTAERDLLWHLSTVWVQLDISFIHYLHLKKINK